eukprot:m.165166 g.165166  ORF g.165166 m.165166 type:complete len:429 (-) comp15231_c1_seq2:868-2154(-)
MPCGEHAAIVVPHTQLVRFSHACQRQLDLVQLVALEEIVAGLQDLLVGLAFVAVDYDEDSGVGASPKYVTGVHSTYPHALTVKLLHLRLVKHHGPLNLPVALVGCKPLAKVSSVETAEGGTLHCDALDIPSGPHTAVVVAESKGLEGTKLAALHRENVRAPALKVLAVVVKAHLAADTLVASKQAVHLCRRAGPALISRRDADLVRHQRARAQSTHELAGNLAVLFVYGKPVIAWKDILGATRRVRHLDAVKKPSCRHARVVVRDADALELAQWWTRHGEAVLLPTLKVIARCVQRERSSLAGRAKEHNADVGVRASMATIAGESVDLILDGRVTAGLGRQQLTRDGTVALVLGQPLPAVERVLTLCLAVCDSNALEKPAGSKASVVVLHRDLLQPPQPRHRKMKSDGTTSHKLLTGQRHPGRCFLAM